ncbi:hypothetical protein GUITHDRAFT_152603 [Guillardia theta CCMP2712]|uniref:Uncharacterized protein n=1 Tax=Guillardia theta (strain CCMP2712) TaxID=905079 RepID=L1JC86_GUITC|nr:hypothetical protein GUITHDRAFT_152603 [Guillardia theta CCMP2712]EKX45912.1 hypothetical protein GUITHDRAFT_152603 [Guillardia theta CCMP2712]|eukprot:XP_005832892.1 hypothetical protein GUITHDRAFT_152603 [Guillardia theta CCMP2712]
MKAVMIAACAAAMGLVVAVSMIWMSQSSSAVALEVNMPEENHPPLFDHTFWGVGNEDRIERRANWALRAIGKMNGTLIEAMIANGTIASESEAIDPALIAEIHQAQHEQDMESDINAPAPERFPFEQDTPAAEEGTEAEGSEEGAEGEEGATEEGAEGASEGAEGEEGATEETTTEEGGESAAVGPDTEEESAQ